METILIVEDNNDFRTTVDRMLRSAGYQTRTVEDHRRVADVVQEGQFDLVVTDVFMPEFDGLEVIRMVRRIKPACPIIAVSGGGAYLAAPSGLRLAEACGANAALYKPFGRAELTDTVAALLARPQCDAMARNPVIDQIASSQDQ